GGAGAGHGRRLHGGAADFWYGDRSQESRKTAAAATNAARNHRRSVRTLGAVSGGFGQGRWAGDGDELGLAITAGVGGCVSRSSGARERRAGMVAVGAGLSPTGGPRRDSRRPLRGASRGRAICHAGSGGAVARRAG